MAPVWEKFASKVAGVVSPRHRRWQRLLRSLTIDPDLLTDPIAPPGPRDFVVCGSPRTGTSLLSGMLLQPPEIVTVMEPWDGLRLPPAELFASLRCEIEETGRMRRGRLDVSKLTRDGAIAWLPEHASAFEVSTAPGYALGVKWPAFWRYIDRLPDTKFVVCLRHPFEVIGSYERVGGRLARGLEYDVPFNRAMNEVLLAATDDVRVRRVLLFDYIHTRLLPMLARPNVLTVRYEDWFTSPQELWADLAAFLDVPLARNAITIEPRAPAPLAPSVRNLVVEHCTTAAALGYSLDPVEQ